MKRRYLFIGEILMRVKYCTIKCFVALNTKLVENKAYIINVAGKSSLLTFHSDPNSDRKKWLITTGWCSIKSPRKINDQSWYI
jgi:hypothetical protein